MTFDPVTQVLVDRLKLKTLPHALLLCGRELPAHETLITHLAQAMNCQQTSAPCGECVPCKKVIGLQHADIFRLKSLKSEIVIAQIHELIHWVHVSPNEWEKKFVWIEDSQNLNTAASNALLKTLEEPPAHLIFFVSAESSGQVLKTIRSRSMLVRVPSSTTFEEGSQLQNPPEWLPDYEAMLKKPSLGIDAIFDLTERLSQNREDLIWFLWLTQKELLTRLKHTANNAAQFSRWESLYAECLHLERQTYERYGNMNLYLDRFLTNWFSAA